MAGRGFRVNFAVPELQREIEKIGAYDRRSAQRLEAVVSTSTKNIGKGAKRRVKKKTHLLEKRISTRFDVKTITGYVAARTPYAHLVEFGAKVHDAPPPFGKSWTDESPYMRPAFEDERPALIRGAIQAVKP